MIKIEQHDTHQGGYTPRNRTEPGTITDGVSFGMLSPSGLIEVIRTMVLPKLEKRRKIVVYIRKSNEEAETNKANYLFFQESLHIYLREAGVPEHLIVIEDEDVGISGIYDATYRPSLHRVEEMLLRDEIEAIVVVDIARIYRDPTNISPAILADRLRGKNVKIVTFDEMPPKVLNMRLDDDYDYFLEKCREAAKYRKRLRHQTGQARIQAVLRGEWSGSPVPIGWALIPAHKVLHAGRYISIAAKLRVYPAHAERKMEIMRLAAHPKISTWEALWKEVRRQGYVIEPFESSIRDCMMTRSCLKNCTKHDLNGKSIAYNPDEAFMPTKWMLYNLLLEPLALGWVLYGSGVRSGRWELKALDKRFLQNMGRTHDSEIRDYREYIGTNEELAICRSQEDIDLFWKMQGKWSEWDAQVSRDSKFTIYTDSMSHERPTAGRPKPEIAANSWVGLLRCLHHGWDDNMQPVTSHLLSYNTGIRKDRGTMTPRWDCWRDVRQGVGDRCATVGSEGGKDKLTVVLDAFFRIRIKDVLEQLSFSVKADKGDQPSRYDRIRELEKEITAKDKGIKRATETLKDLVESWEENEETNYTQEEIKKKRKEFIAEHIMPMEGAKIKLIKTRDELKAHNDEDISAESTIRTAGQVVRKVLDSGGWEKLSNNTRQRVLTTLIDYVGVWIDKEPITDNVVMMVKWKHGHSDMLVTWRNPPQDSRPFTHEEDAHLQQWWASDCNVEHLRSLLQPGRRYNLVRRRAQQLGITGAARSHAWRNEYDHTGKSYVQHHPATAYFWLTNACGSWAEINHHGEEVSRGPLPSGIVESIFLRDSLIGEIIKGDTSSPGKRPVRPP